MLFPWRNLTAGAALLAAIIWQCAASAAPAPPSVMHEYTRRALTEGEAPAVMELAEQGDGKAQLILGRSYLAGDGVPEDLASAFRWLERATQNGYAKEVGALADSVFLFRRKPEERKLAKDLYQSACEAGHLPACSMLGYAILTDGDGVEEGLRFLRKAAEGGDAGGQLSLGEYLGWVTSDKANLVPRDDKEAFKWLLKAAEQGHFHAMLRVGEFYEAGQGVKQNLDAARRWYEQGAERGSLGCKLALGEIYEFGKGVPQDGQKALTIYRSIADAGSVNAHERIGRIYEFGRGVPQSYSEAFKWYDTGRLMMETETAYRLGVLCEEGKVVPRDVKNAREYYESARTPDAALRLGKSYLQEPAPLQDPQKALTWLLVAKLKGHSEADPLLATVIPMVAPEHRAAAAAEAKEWFDFDRE